MRPMPCCTLLPSAYLPCSGGCTALRSIHSDQRGIMNAMAKPITAMRQLAAWFALAGLQVSQDAVANVHGQLPGSDPEAPELVLGSHYDTVPRAGR